MTLTAPAPASPASSALDRLTALIAADMAAVDRLIEDRMTSAVPMIPELAAHLIRAGGKRVRPMVTLATAGLLGYRGDGHHKLAATVEFIHTATLLHDDVVDDSALRRGRDAANVVWGNAASVLVGDFLFARAFNLMVEPGSLRILQILSNASSVIAEGEVAQLAAANRVETTVAQYYAIITAKTAALFSAAAQVSAVLSERPSEEETALADYGRELGVAFQLVDDALDYGGVQSELGKTVGDDFREGKITMPVALAYAAGGEDQRAFWARTMAFTEQTADDFTTALGYLREHGALDATMSAASTHAQAAKTALERFPTNAYRSALEDLADFVVSRGY